MKVKIAFKPAIRAYTKEKCKNHTRIWKWEEKERIKQQNNHQFAWIDQENKNSEEMRLKETGRNDG